MSVKTNSPVLAQGLCWLYALMGQPAPSMPSSARRTVYYQLNLRRTAFASAAQGRAPAQGPGRGPPDRRARADDEEWVFDLETESGVFSAGVGPCRRP